VNVQFDWSMLPPALEARLTSRAGAISDALIDKVNQLSVELQAHIVRDKLSLPGSGSHRDDYVPGSIAPDLGVDYPGQVLRRISANLSGSIILQEAAKRGEEILGGVGLGSEAWYGKLHEFGGEFNIPAHMRAGHPVRAYTMTLPERSFMRAALKDMEERFQSEVRDTILQVVME
jgi:hypothetical protein